MSITLRGGYETSDVRLDRLPQFDERSRAFPIAAVVPETLRSRSWPCASYLDQGHEGACVGFSWSHEANAWPAVWKLQESDARFVYRQAQLIDEWPGEAYEGTSVLAGAKVSQSLGYFAEYRWAFSVEEVMRAIAHEGPVVLGIPWLDSMFQPRPSGLMDCSGSVAGGHAILARGVILSGSLRGEGNLGEPYFRLRNSWSASWGVNGDCFVRASDLERLLSDWGEACVPVGRNRP